MTTFHIEELSEPIEDRPAHWPVLGGTDLARGGITVYRRERVRMEDGTEADREYTLHPGAVGAIVYDEERDRVLSLCQYRHPVRRLLWELPAGLLDADGESPLEAARRELFEEAHLTARTWNVLADYYNTAGSSNEAMRVYLARGIDEAAGDQFDRQGEEKTMRPAWLNRVELTAAVFAGKVTSGAMVVGTLALATALAHPDGLDSLRPGDAPWPARPF
ncbi:MAG TPA: NUDIX hydrolase [Actinocrinis sp.]|nr:NUDIX hydrolase [Actinocrinis sp.]